MLLAAPLVCYLGLRAFAEPSRYEWRPCACGDELFMRDEFGDWVLVDPRDHPEAFDMQ